MLTRAHHSPGAGMSFIVVKWTSLVRQFLPGDVTEGYALSILLIEYASDPYWKVFFF